jgi:hypothetical protein
MKRLKINILILNLAAISLIPQIARAQGVGNIGALPVVIPQNANGNWNVGTAQNPIPVVRDPNGPKWMKQFTDPSGGPFTAVPGQTFNVVEHLLVAPQPDWYDWHEEILTPEWEWDTTANFVVNPLAATNLQITTTPATPTTGGTINFTFDPIAHGSTIDIFKRIRYVGLSGAPFTGVIDIAQYPTPEPGSLLLLAGGGLLLLRRRRTHSV